MKTVGPLLLNDQEFQDDDSKHGALYDCTSPIPIKEALIGVDFSACYLVLLQKAQISARCKGKLSNNWGCIQIGQTALLSRVCPSGECSHRTWETIRHKY